MYIVTSLDSSCCFFGFFYTFGRPTFICCFAFFNGVFGLFSALVLAQNTVPSTN